MVMYRQAIKNVPLFQELNLLVASGSHQKLPDKNVIFQEDDSGEVLFIILSGKVKVLLTGKNGEEFILSYVSPGNFFGEMAILESAPRSPLVITVEPSEFFVLG